VFPKGCNNHHAPSPGPTQTDSQLILIACTERLRRKSGGPHAQEPERPEREREDQAANGYRADVHGFG
jgi:hypothetical protein